MGGLIETWPAKDRCVVTLGKGAALEATGTPELRCGWTDRECTLASMASWLALRSAILDVEIEEQDWIEALHTEARMLFDEGLGTFAYSYRVEQGRRICIDALAGHTGAPELWRALSSWGDENQHALASIYRTGIGSVDSAVRSAARAAIALSSPRRWFESHGVADVLTVLGHDPSGFGVFLTMPRARHAAVGPTPAQRRTLERLAIELAAAARLREHRRRTRVARLSASELHVARLLMDGASDKLIASELGVSLSTVSTFTRRVRGKLGCRPGEEVLTLHARRSSASLRRRLALFDQISAAECDVVSELLVGSSYALIAERRGVSVRTVASQCASIFRKLRVSGRRELASTLLRG